MLVDIDPKDPWTPDMRYDEFRDLIQTELRRSGDGLTWSQLKDRLDLPYERPCPEWVKRMEREIGLLREKGDGRAYVWTVERQTAKSS